MALEAGVLAAVLIPFVSRALHFQAWKLTVLRTHPSEEQHDRDAHRSVILAVGALSFTGIFALAVAEAALRENLQVPSLYLTVSFLCSFFAFSVQGWKNALWHDIILGDGFIDAAWLTLLLSLVHLVGLADQFGPRWVLTAIAALGMWGVDHWKRMRDWMQYLGTERWYAQKGVKMSQDKQQGQRPVPTDKSVPTKPQDQKGLTTLRCPKCGTPYPKGGSCPRCSRQS